MEVYLVGAFFKHNVDKIGIFEIMLKVYNIGMIQRFMDFYL